MCAIPNRGSKNGCPLKTLSAPSVPKTGGIKLLMLAEQPLTHAQARQKRRDEAMDVKNEAAKRKLIKSQRAEQEGAPHSTEGLTVMNLSASGPAKKGKFLAAPQQQVNESHITNNEETPSHKVGQDVVNVSITGPSKEVKVVSLPENKEEMPTHKVVTGPYMSYKCIVPAQVVLFKRKGEMLTYKAGQNAMNVSATAPSKEVKCIVPAQVVLLKKKKETPSHKVGQNVMNVSVTGPSKEVKWVSLLKNTEELPRYKVGKDAMNVSATGPSKSVKRLVPAQVAPNKKHEEMPSYTSQEHLITPEIKKKEEIPPYMSVRMSSQQLLTAAAQKQQLLRSQIKKNEAVPTYKFMRVPPQEQLILHENKKEEMPSAKVVLASSQGQLVKTKKEEEVLCYKVVRVPPQEQPISWQNKGKQAIPGYKMVHMTQQEKCIALQLKMEDLPSYKLVLASTQEKKDEIPDYAEGLTAMSPPATAPAPLTPAPLVHVQRSIITFQRDSTHNTNALLY